MELMQWAAWLAGAVAVVGAIQWAKGLLPKAPSWLWIAAMPVASIGAAFAAGGTHPWFDALGIAAIAQLGYELVVQKVRKALGGTDAPAEPTVKGFGQ